MASGIKSSNSDLVINADGAGNDIVFQQNGVEVGRVGEGGLGKVLQVVYEELTTSGTSSVTIPYDGSIPQQTEGVEILSASITPSSADSKIMVQVQAQFGENSNTANHGVCALFRDSGADAIAIGTLGSGPDNANLTFDTVNITHIENAVSTNITTFKIRVGLEAGTVRWNGWASTQYYGASNKTTITLMEIGA